MIAYMVACFKYNNTGMGGHYYTAFSIFSEMKKHERAVLIVLGDLKPAAIDFSAADVYYIPVSRWLRRSDFHNLYEFIMEKEAIVLHSFDTYSFLFARIIGQFANVRVVSTKCGGPRPLFHYFPRVCPDTVFSPEEIDYFKRRVHFFKLPPPVLLPNRVVGMPGKPAKPECAELPYVKNSDSIKIIRIARMCHAYEASIINSFALAKLLRKRGFDVVLYIVGFIQDYSVLTRIKRIQTVSDYILTDDCYTRNASRHIGGVDIVVATGRGVMEACLSEKIICCPVKGSNVPYLMDAKNFYHFFYYNFSPRAGKLKKRDDGNIDEISNLLKNKKKFWKYCQDMKSIHRKYFDISYVVSDYIKIYNEERFKKKSLVNIIDLFIHLLMSISKLGIRKIQHHRRCRILNRTDNLFI